MVIDLAGRQQRHHRARANDAGLTRREGVAHDLVGLGDIEGVANLDDTEGRVQLVDQYDLLLGPAVAVGVTQQHDPVACLDRTVRPSLDEAEDQVLGPGDGLARRTPAFDGQHIAVGQGQHVARPLHIGAQGRDGEAGRDCRHLVVLPPNRRGDFHGRDQKLSRRRQLWVRALLLVRREFRFAAGPQGQHDAERRQGRGADHDRPPSARRMTS